MKTFVEYMEDGVVSMIVGFSFITGPALALLYEPFAYFGYPGDGVLDAFAWGMLTATAGVVYSGMARIR